MTLAIAIVDAVSRGLTDVYIAFVSLAMASALGLVVFGIAMIGAPRS